MPNRKRLSFIIIVAILIPIVPFLIIGELPGERWLSSTDENALLFGLTGSGILASDILLPIPSSIVGTLLGARLGLIAGGFWIWTGLMVGTLISYLLGRLLLGRKDESWPTTPTLTVLFLSRPVPVFAEAATLIAGAQKIPLLPTLGACALGNAIYAGVLAANGAFLIPGALIGPGLVIPMALPVLAWLVWRHWTALSGKIRAFEIKRKR